MATISIDIPDELSAQLDQIRDRLPELLALSLHQPAIPAYIYRTILDFLATRPTPDEIMAFRPAPEMQARLATLLARSYAGQITRRGGKSPGVQGGTILVRTWQTDQTCYRYCTCRIGAEQKDRIIATVRAKTRTDSGDKGALSLMPVAARPGAP